MKLKNVNRKMMIIILIILLITIFAILISSTYLRTVVNNAKKEQVVGELFSSIVYDNQNEEEIKVLVKISSEDGIEYIEKPDGSQIQANGKQNVAIDYKVKKDEENIFKIKEIGKEIVDKSVCVTDQVIKEELGIDVLSEIVGYKTIEITENIPLEGYNKIQHQIGKNGEWQEGIGKMPIVDYDIVRNALKNEDDTVTVSVKAENTVTSNIIQYSKNLKIKNTTLIDNIQAESLIDAMSKENIETGKYGVTINNKTYNLQVYEFNENLTIDVSTEFGTEQDVATDTDYAQNMIAIKVNGDLNINGEAILTTHASKSGYGGPKGMFIYCTGTIINNGEISMTARGAKAEGEDVYLYKNNDNTYEYVPAEGATGGKGLVRVGGGNGNDGEKGLNRQTGGGGSGAVYSGLGGVGTSGDGSYGTSYSGGTGGGAWYSYSTGTAEAGQPNRWKRTVGDIR